LARYEMQNDKIDDNMMRVLNMGLFVDGLVINILDFA
jgi:hypothetical protein